MNTATKTHGYPDGFDKSTIETLITDISGLDTAEAVEAITAKFMGCPYVNGPLKGSHNEAEQMCCSTTEFDCVTLVETVVATLNAKSPDHMLEVLKEIRYQDGTVDWGKRNHYSIDWILSNEERGYVKNITPTEEEGAVSVTRNLSILPEYPARERALRFLPEEEFLKQIDKFKTGDLIYFGTGRDDLDVFHVAILVKKEDGIVFRHAAKSLGDVNDENPTDFFDRVRPFPGVIIVRPVRKTS